MVLIIDYNTGNVASVANMIRRVGGEAEISSDPEKIKKAEKLILCGVGTFDEGMNNLNKSGLTDVLYRRVCEEKTPLLAICLGMHMLTRGSEEGVLPGLGWIDADTHRFPAEIAGQKLRVPHMGWNQVRVVRENVLLPQHEEGLRFYFVHAYYVKTDRTEDILTETDYGIKFTSAFQKENITGMQFHPEKSHKFGMALFKNFISDTECS